MTAFNIIKSLTKRGNVVLGAGCYAAVLETKTEKVLKVGAQTTDPWLDYYSLVIKHNQKNQHVPKTYHVHIDNQHDYYVCYMERLVPLSDDLKDLAKLCEDFTKGWLDDEEIIKALHDYSENVPNPQELVAILKQIKELTQAHKAYSSDDVDASARTLDLHTGNFMLRNDVLVVTDPWCEHDMSDLRAVNEWLNHHNIYSSYNAASCW